MYVLTVVFLTLFLQFCNVTLKKYSTVLSIEVVSLIEMGRNLKPTTKK